MRSFALRRAVAVAMLALFLPVTTAGCFGRFALTRKIYKFNRDLSHDRWVRWFGFILLNFVPFYLAGAVIDLVLANSIEFWGGDNPFAAIDAPTRYAVGPNGEIVASTVVAPGVMELEVIEPAGAVHRLRIVREDGALAAYDAEGLLLGRVGDVHGRAVVLSR